jgi:hypothetical protein
LKDLTALRNEIVKPQYDGMDDAAIAAAINSAAPVAGPYHDIPMDSAVGLLALSGGAWFKIEQQAKKDLTGDPVQDPATVAAASLVTVSSRVKTLATGDDTKRGVMIQMLQALMAAQLIAQSDIDGLVALASSTISLGASLGFKRPLDFNDVTMARSS